jgi:hypothetical protein
MRTTDLYVMSLINFELRKHRLGGYDLRKSITALVSVLDNCTARKIIAVHPDNNTNNLTD